MTDSTVACSHHLVYQGAADPSEGSGCERPRRLVCHYDAASGSRGCGLSVVIDCGSTRSSLCGPCSTRYRERVRRIARSGFRRVVAPGQAVMLTLTSPGDKSHYRKGSPCPCTPPGGVDLAVWNASAAHRWHTLVTTLRNWSRDFEYLRAVEVQDGKRRADGVGRGALHFHVLLVLKSPGPFFRRPVSLEELRALAILHGFGHEFAWDVVDMQSRAVSYVTKYVSKAVDARAAVPWRKQPKLGARRVKVDLFSGEVLPSSVPTYRPWSASRRFGLRMSAVRAAQRHYATVAAAVRTWEDFARFPLHVFTLPDVPADPAPS